MTQLVLILVVAGVAAAYAWGRVRYARGRADGAAAPARAALAVSVADALGIVFWAIDRTEIIRLSRGRLLHDLGLAPGELRGRRLATVEERGEGTRDGHDEADIIRAVFADGVTRNLTHRHARPDGSALYICTEYAALRLDPRRPGRVTHVCGVGVDVTAWEERNTDLDARRERAEHLARKYGSRIDADFQELLDG